MLKSGRAFWRRSATSAASAGGKPHGEDDQEVLVIHLGWMG
jgi:hypothetical protein